MERKPEIPLDVQRDCVLRFNKHVKHGVSFRECIATRVRLAQQCRPRCGSPSNGVTGSSAGGQACYDQFHKSCYNTHEQMHDFLTEVEFIQSAGDRHLARLGL